MDVESSGRIKVFTRKQGTGKGGKLRKMKRSNTIATQ